MAISISGNTGSSQLPSTTATGNTRSTPTTSFDTTTENAVSNKITFGAQPTDRATYTDPRATVKTAADLQSMLEQSNRQAQAVIDLILPLVQQQGLNLAKLVSGEQQLNVDQAAIDKAKAAIADDGEFGFTQIAERILNFARAAIGDDPAKLASIRAAVEKGFKEASDMLGGTLPDISQKTHTVIMAEFDRWEKTGIPSGDTVKLPIESKTDTTAAAS